MNPHMEHSL